MPGASRRMKNKRVRLLQANINNCGSEDVDYYKSKLNE